MVIKTSQTSNLCPSCGKTVFAAEEKIAGGHKWHKACFKCGGYYYYYYYYYTIILGLSLTCSGVCNKRLDSTLCNENDGKIFCKTCYSRRLGPKGYGFGQGAGTLSTDAETVPDSTDSGQP